MYRTTKWQHTYSTTPNNSRAVFPASLGQTTRHNDPIYSLCHNVFVFVSTPFVNPLGFYLALVPEDPLDINIDININIVIIIITAVITCCYCLLLHATNLMVLPVKGLREICIPPRPLHEPWGYSQRSASIAIRPWRADGRASHPEYFQNSTRNTLKTVRRIRAPVFS